jgi:hypothetical protein
VDNLRYLQLGFFHYKHDRTLSEAISFVHALSRSLSENLDEVSSLAEGPLRITPRITGKIKVHSEAAQLYFVRVYAFVRHLIYEAPHVSKHEVIEGLDMKWLPFFGQRTGIAKV